MCIFSVFRYIPVLMQQAKIYWDMENYQQVEKIFRKSVEFCNEHDVWKLNVAHVLFMQENKFKEATGFYEPIVKKHYDNVSIYCDVPGSPCLSKKRRIKCAVRSFKFFLCRWLSSLSGSPVDGPKDPWPRVLSLPERFVGEPVSLARDNIYINGV